MRSFIWIRHVLMGDMWRGHTHSHPLLLANLYVGTWRRGGGGIRRSHFVAMAHLKAELWLVRWYQNKHGGSNESNKAFENKLILLNITIKQGNQRWLVSWFPGSAKASPGNQETRRRDQLVPQTINHGFPYTQTHTQTHTEGKINSLANPFGARLITQ